MVVVVVNKTPQFCKPPILPVPLPPCTASLFLSLSLSVRIRGIIESRGDVE